jgi:hypothetical protein
MVFSCVAAAASLADGGSDEMAMMNGLLRLSIDLLGSAQPDAIPGLDSTWKAATNGTSMLIRR